MEYDVFYLKNFRTWGKKPAGLADGLMIPQAQEQAGKLCQEVDIMGKGSAASGIVSLIKTPLIVNNSNLLPAPIIFSIP